MALGLGLLRLEPAAFWAMTPRELGMALGPFERPGGAALARPELDSLMRQFPDRPNGGGDG